MKVRKGWSLALSAILLAFLLGTQAENAIEWIGDKIHQPAPTVRTEEPN